MGFKCIGSNVHIMPGSTIEHRDMISLGSHIYIGPGASIWASGGLTVADNVIFGPRVTIHTTNHNYDVAGMLPYDGVTVARPVTIETNAWIGDHTLICPGVTVHRYCKFGHICRA